MINYSVTDNFSLFLYYFLFFYFFKFKYIHSSQKHMSQLVNLLGNCRGRTLCCLCNANLYWMRKRECARTPPPVNLVKCAPVSMCGGGKGSGLSGREGGVAYAQVEALMHAAQKHNSHLRACALCINMRVENKAHSGCRSRWTFFADRSAFFFSFFFFVPPGWKNNLLLLLRSANKPL